MATELAAQHPTETWQLITGGTIVIAGLVGVLYRRLNQDVKDSFEHHEQTDKRINDQARELEGVATNVAALMDDVKEIFNKLTYGAKSFSELRVDMREVETRIDGVMRELEQKAGLHQEAVNDLKRGFNELKRELEMLERKCASQHPARLK